MNPKARNEGVMVSELGDELVLYDERSSRAHRLNPTAAAVWRHADGETTVLDIAMQVADELGVEPSGDLVQLGLATLQEADLLEVPAKIVDRRQLIRRVAVAAAVIPAVWTIGAPTPAAAQSGSGIDCADPSTWPPGPVPPECGGGPIL